MVKIQRSFPAPASLETEIRNPSGGSYSEADVLQRLKEDFHDKCYICELRELQDPEVEHLLPHKNRTYPERVFDWNNLFWACGHCNKVKNQRKYDEGVLDCCNQDPEEVISFRLQENKVIVGAKNAEDSTAVLTAMLVEEVFNLKNTAMRDYKRDFRFRKLNEEMNILYDNLEEMKKNPESRIIMRKLKALLRRESQFAAFKRAYVRENGRQFPQLLPYIA